ncbi:MAG: toll/interleukin-1 receptor domain-containing protein [Acidobacteriota bacterium]|nr:toll/interleukin-1 receptor domain-containing protein [Acidobacteriota bacterium]
MKPTKDLFISYAHRDNRRQPEGWVTSFHTDLELQLGELCGRDPKIWRDQKLQGNDFFDEEIVEQLPDVAAMISVLSPSYVRSEWCQRELKAFRDVAEKNGGFRLENKSRVFKVLKSHVPLEEHPDEIRQLTGYKFYTYDQDRKQFLPYESCYGPDIERQYWIQLNDLAQDIAKLLHTFEQIPEEKPASESSPTQAKETIYLAETTWELRERRLQLKRELEQHGYTVLPAGGLAGDVDLLTDQIDACLQTCTMSIHLLGNKYGFVPEGTEQSLPELQYRLAVKQGERGNISRLIWVPPDREPEPRQAGLLESLFNTPASQQNADMIERPFVAFQTAVIERLADPPKPVPEPEIKFDFSPQIYLICTEEDMDAADPIIDHLVNEGYDVVLPTFDGDEAALREDHRNNLRLADAVLIYYGRPNSGWLRAQFMELRKVAAYGRTEPLAVKAIYEVQPGSHRRAGIRVPTDELIAGASFDPNSMTAFLNKLNERYGAP